jgi:hypothetical protein
MGGMPEVGLRRRVSRFSGPLGQHPPVDRRVERMAKFVGDGLAEIVVENLDADKRPLAATADFHELFHVVSVTIREDTSTTVQLLFDADHSLEEWIIAEQFLSWSLAGAPLRLRRRPSGHARGWCCLPNPPNGVAFTGDTWRSGATRAGFVRLPAQHHASQVAGDAVLYLNAEDDQSADHRDWTPARGGSRMPPRRR